MNAYEEHVEKAKEELTKLRTARWEAVSRVYDLEQNIAMLERHVGTLLELGKKTEPEKEAVPAIAQLVKKANGLEQKPNG